MLIHLTESRDTWRKLWIMPAFIWGEYAAAAVVDFIETEGEV